MPLEKESNAKEKPNFRHKNESTRPTSRYNGTTSMKFVPNKSTKDTIKATLCDCTAENTNTAREQDAHAKRQIPAKPVAICPPSTMPNAPTDNGIEKSKATGRRNTQKAENPREAYFENGENGMESLFTKSLRRKTRSGTVTIDANGMAEKKFRKSDEPRPATKNFETRKNLNETKAIVKTAEQ